MKEFPHLRTTGTSPLPGQGIHALGVGHGDEIKAGSAVFDVLKIEREEVMRPQWCNETEQWNGAIQEGLLCCLNDFQQASCVGEPSNWYYLSVVCFSLYCKLLCCR